MKAYILKDDDFESLVAAINCDTRQNGRLTEEEARVYEDAHRFFNYHVQVWIQKMRA